MSDNVAAVVIEALYQVAADPTLWRQVIEALGDEPLLDAPAPSTLRGLNNSLAVAGLVAAREPSAGPEIGWLLVSLSGQIAGSNERGRSLIEVGLGEAPPGGFLRFEDPENDEALGQAVTLMRISEGRNTIVKLKGRDDGPCFAYVAPPGALRELGWRGPVDAAGFGLVFPAVEETGRIWDALRHSFGLTPAELRLAGRLRDGRSLKEASEDLGLSFNTVRNQLRAIFEKMGLKRQSELIQALSALSRVSAVLDRPIESAVTDAPLLARRRLSDGRILAYRTYGVPDGKPMLIFHEGLGSSLLPSGAHALAIELGLYVICPERPGFGQSDLRADYSFEGVADDMVELCDGLGLGTLRIVAILSGTPSAIETAIKLGPRAEGVLLCTGRPPRPTQNGVSILPRFRARLENNPWVTETFFAILRLHLSHGLVRHLTRAATAKSEGDRAFLAANPWAIGYIADSAAECLVLGCRGVVQEMQAFRRAGNSSAADLRCPLVVWHGADDSFAPLKDLLDYLGDRPAQVIVTPGVGHLLALARWKDMFRLAAEAP